MNLNSDTSNATNPNSTNSNQVSSSVTLASNNELLYFNFNQDFSCFSCGTTNGFIIYNVDPFKETFRRIFPNGGIGIVEMLYRCNILAIVGGGKYPRYSLNKVMIWDDHQNKAIGELKFKSNVKAVKLRKDRIVVVLETKVYVYNFKDLKLLDNITTIMNPNGLVSLCTENTSNILAVPGLNHGYIRIELYNLQKSQLIKAHDASLSCFTLNSNGTLLASASEKGTLIRIWNTYTGEPLRELRRGMDRAEIYSLSFNMNSTFLSCSSDKGTVHIFSLTSTPVKASSNTIMSNEDVEDSNTISNQGSNTSSYVNANLSNPANPSNSSTSNKSITGVGNFLKGILPQKFIPKYFESEWSFGQVRGIEGKAICSFSKDSSKINILCSDGNFIVASVQQDECPKLTVTKFMKTSNSNNTYSDGNNNYNDEFDGLNYDNNNELLYANA